MAGLIGSLVDGAQKAAAGAMADLAAAAAPAEGVTPAGPTGPAHPPRTWWAFFVRAWRPACGWMIAVLLARSAIVPLVQLARGLPVEATDWTALAAMAGVLFVTRSYERSQGIA
jgi:hypothetical protein